MDRLFLDANVLFSAAYRPNAGLLKLWKLKKVTLCSSRFALEEARINLTHEVQRSRLARLSRNIHLFDAPPKELPDGVLLPDKDVPTGFIHINERRHAFIDERNPWPIVLIRVADIDVPFGNELLEDAGDFRPVLLRE